MRERRAWRRAAARGSLRVGVDRGRCRRPGWRTSVLQVARSSARASRTSGRSSRRNGARSLVAGLDAATSRSRSSSVARRFTNVVLARRSVVGSSAERPRERARSRRRSRRSSCSCCRRASARSSRRSAIAVTAREELTMKRVSAPSSSRELADQPARGREERVEVLGRLGGLLALARRTASAKPWMTSCRSPARLRVERVEELVEVDDARSSTSVAERRAVVELSVACRARA